LIKILDMSYQIKRLTPLDALRGLIMILMTIDHANYFIARQHPVGEFWGIALPHYDTMMSFLTRFVTHPCAPGFFFLMGVSMILFAESRRNLGWSEGKIMRHFLIRGALLLFLQQFAENPAWFLGPVYLIKAPGGDGPVWFHIGVLFGLGATMIIGALLLRLNAMTLICLGTITTIISQILVPDPSKSDYLYSPLLRLMLIPGQTGMIQVFYPILPWLGVVLFGIAFGKWIVLDVKRTYRKALIIGIIFMLLFVVVRIAGGFGNIHPPESSGVIDFLNVIKYPPSIAFILIMLGINLLIIFFLSRTGAGLEQWGKPLLVFGRAALFFYIVHLYIYSLMGLLFAAKGGTNLLVMYLLWAGGLILLYPLCKWYGNFKRGNPADSLWRFF
jgi:uncharacterized membrane protein